MEQQDRPLDDRLRGYDEPGPAASPPLVTVRPKAWVYYTVLAVMSFVVLCAGKAEGLLGVVLFGLYARYLYRGGQVVIWFW